MPTAVESAIADLIGCRIAWLGWGKTIGYQAQQYGPLKLEAGKGAWQRIVLSSPATLLGMAWQALEERENHEQGAQEPEWPKVPNKGATEEMGTIAWTESTMLEPGYYAASVKNIEETVSEFPDEKNPGKMRKVAQLKFTFAILDAEGKPSTNSAGSPEEQWGWCSATWGPRAKLLTWAKILLKSKCPGPGELLDWELLLGKKCDIEIVSYDSANGPRPKIAALYAFRSMSGAEDES